MTNIKHLLSKELSRLSDEDKALYNKYHNKETANNGVAETILKQLGGMNKLVAMIGAKNFVSSNNSVQFQLPKAYNKIKIVKIELATDDTYTIRFYQVRGFDTDVIKSIDRIHADRLKETIENATGLRLALASTNKELSNAPNKDKLNSLLSKYNNIKIVNSKNISNSKPIPHNAFKHSLWFTDSVKIEKINSNVVKEGELYKLTNSSYENNNTIYIWFY